MTEMEREKETRRRYVTKFLTGNNCNFLQSSKAREKVVRDIFSIHIRILIKCFLSTLRNKVDKTSNWSQN